VVDDLGLRRYALARSGLLAGSALCLVAAGQNGPGWLILSCLLAVASFLLVVMTSGIRRTLAVVSADVLLPLVLISSTGGEASPFLLFLYLAVIVAGINLDVRAALLTAGATSFVVVWTLLRPEIAGGGDPAVAWVRCSTTIAFLFVVAVLAGYLGEVFRRRAAPKDPLSERLAKVGQLSAVIVHELRNLLKPLSGAVELLEGDLGKDPRQEPVLRLIREECRAMEGFLGEFLEYTRDAPLATELVHVDELLEEVAGRMARHPEARGARIEVSGERELTLDGDGRSLRRALSNVVLNCVQASPTGCIEIAAHGSGERDVLLSVTDDGPGIEAAQRDAIFEPFFTTRGAGTGLGLAVVKRCVERHGGQIAVTEGPHGGARFEIRLPLTPAVTERESRTA
jgi:signal transduction histidine kinase